MRYTIGGHTISISGQADADLASRLPGMSVFEAEEAANDEGRIMLDANLTLPDCRWHHRFGLADDTMECRFGTDSEGVYYYAFGDCGLLRFDSRQPDKVQCSHLGDPELLRYALWTSYAMMGLHLGALPIHASTVVNGGRAVLCLGESGTGKSTHTHLWVKHIEGSYLLNDDSPIVSIEGDEVVVYGSPWSGKTPCYRRERLPIAALLRLEQRPENSIRRLGTVEAFTALQPSCPPSLAREERCLDKLVDFVSAVISHVPVYRMGCLPDADAARLSFSTIMSSHHAD
ncbi:MAG: hypothetical protein J6V98_06335 [Bacteroidales bacterium]|nr:hypothetical protein [Bacteroidales bacterium]